MTTYGQQMIQAYSEAAENLERLSHAGYEPAQVRDVVTSVASKTELFLKSVILPAARSRNTFEWFIDELTGLGASQDCRDKLHALRRKYNDSKHDPNVVIGLVSATAIVKGGSDAIGELVKGGFGTVNAEIPRHMTRVYWIAAWDHYTSGDTEIHVIIPAKSEHWLGPPTFDIINVKFDAVDPIKAELARLGVFTAGEGLIPASQYDAFREDSEFFDAWVFEGDYRSLITTLAKYELRQELIPGLNRQDDSRAMILAYLLGAVDSVSSALSDNDLESRIDEHAKLSYGVPPDYNHSAYLSEGMASMFRLVPSSSWPRITGPLWSSKEAFDSHIATAVAKHTKYAIAIDNDFVIRACFV